MIEGLTLKKIMHNVDVTAATIEDRDTILLRYRQIMKAIKGINRQKMLLTVNNETATRKPNIQETALPPLN